MKYKRLLRKVPIDLRLVGTVILAVIILVQLFFVPPTNTLIISAFTISITGFIYLLSSYFVELKYQYIITLFVFLFLTINYLVGFDLMNTALLVSFIIGLALIVK